MESLFRRALEVRDARRNGIDDGFTLIELLIVIVILGVLAGIVVFAVSGVSDRGNSSACKADAATVNTASGAYYAKNGSYAADVATLVSSGFLQSAPSSDKYTITYTGGKATCSLAA